MSELLNSLFDLIKFNNKEAINTIEEPTAKTTRYFKTQPSLGYSPLQRLTVSIAPYDIR